MLVRKLKDGKELSALGFGLMRLPMKGNEIDQEQVNLMVKEAIESGVNYFDTSYVYHEQKSEGVLAKAIKGYRREDLHLADKLPVWLLESEEDCERYLDEMLERLEVTYLDALLLHAMDYQKLDKVKKFNVIEWGNQKKKEGKIKYFGFSIHEKYEMLVELLDLNEWDFVQIQFNYIDIVHEPGLQGYLELERRKIPVIIMEPLKGGTLARIPAHLAKPFEEVDSQRSQASFGFRWLLEHAAIVTILSGMGTIEQMRDNIQTFSIEQSFSEKEALAVQEVRANLEACIKVPCTGCNYCMPCPFGVNIPKVFRVYNERAKYTGILNQQPGTIYDMKAYADLCIACQKCVPLCPQHIDIPVELEKIKIEENR